MSSEESGRPAFFLTVDSSPFHCVSPHEFCHIRFAYWIIFTALGCQFIRRGTGITLYDPKSNHESRYPIILHPVHFHTSFRLDSWKAPSVISTCLSFPDGRASREGSMWQWLEARGGGGSRRSKGKAGGIETGGCGGCGGCVMLSCLFGVEVWLPSGFVSHTVFSKFCTALHTGGASLLFCV